MSLEIAHLTKYYGSRAVVSDVSFTVGDGELVTLLGPSGSGKSTILRIVAGLIRSDDGRVCVDGVDVTELPPKARDLGFVFQSYALFEHLDVAANVEFALRVRGVPRAERRQRRDELLDLVGLGGSARKYPSQLSGGQRQRTALARALAHRPRLLLLDEPFGALDARIRQELRQNLRELLKQLGTTAVFVTHDQEEAFSLADRIMVLHRGRLLEQGAPEQLYQAPQTEFVASFVGRANLLPGELTGDGVRVRLAGASAQASVVPKRVKVLARPEHLRLLPLGTDVRRVEGELLSGSARVEQLEYLGSSQRVYLSIDQADGSVGGGRRYRIESVRDLEAAARLPLQPGDRVAAVASHVHAITQPNLRLLVLAQADEAGRRLFGQALAFGERVHGVITVLGEVVRDPGLAASIDRHRQSFAGDLRLVDPGDQDLALWQAMERLLGGEQYDLVLLSESLRGDPAELMKLLRSSGADHVVLAGREGDPFRPGHGHPSWHLLLRPFSGAGADLSLLAELAAASEAQVDVRDLGGLHRHADVVERSAAALDLRRVAFSIARSQAAIDTASPGQWPDLPDGGLAAIDLGPRGGLDSRQQGALQAFGDRWLLVLVQPDAADLQLRTATGFLPSGTAPGAPPTAPEPTAASRSMAG